MAKSWAEYCAKTGVLGHQPNNQYGENLFYMFSSDYDAEPTGRDVLKKWYDEEKDYEYGTESLNSLNFTQLVWKSSEELGIAMAKNQNGQTFVVANYNPRGNVRGYFADNVQKPKS